MATSPATIPLQKPDKETCFVRPTAISNRTQQMPHENAAKFEATTALTALEFNADSLPPLKPVQEKNFDINVDLKI